MNWIKENWLLIFLAIVIAIAAFFSWNLVKVTEVKFGTFFPDKASREEWGVLGDFFGGLLNPFFALLGLLMLLVTLFQNQKELSLSRKEFEDSATALRSQANTLEKQRFEDTFFSLLEQHNIALNNITKGRIVYDANGNQRNKESIATRVKVTLIGGGDFMPVLQTFSGLQKSKETLLKENKDLNQYFRILYQVLKFIASNCPSSTVLMNYAVDALEASGCSVEEKLYSNIVRSLLADEVYYLLAINCSSIDRDDTFYKYRLLLERYSFLEHMPLIKSNMFNNSLMNEIIHHYRASAFGNNREYLPHLQQGTA